MKPAPTTITNSTPPVSENATIQTKSSSTDVEIDIKGKPDLPLCREITVEIKLIHSPAVLQLIDVMYCLK